MNWEDEELRRSQNGEDEGDPRLIVALVLMIIGVCVSGALALVWLFMEV